VAAEKNLDLAVRALREVRRGSPDATLVVAGDGPARGMLEGQEGVVLVGRLADEALAAHLASADLFLFPSLTETFGNVLCEAMASGLATVSFSYAAAARHVRDGVNGLTVPYGDASAFLRSVALAAADTRMRERLGAAARGTMEHVGWDRVVTRFERVARSIVARRESV
jgi:glycosyltransferase involved in cell wall biosynthesis